MKEYRLTQESLNLLHENGINDAVLLNILKCKNNKSIINEFMKIYSFTREDISNLLYYVIYSQPGFESNENKSWNLDDHDLIFFRELLKNNGVLIRKEIEEIELGRADRADNVLKGAPHTADHICSDQWAHTYSRQKAAYPLAWIKERKFWPSVVLS